jgi:GNAT superfamily N-acetyltransferase
VPVEAGWAGFPEALPLIIAAAQGDEPQEWGPHLFFGEDVITDRQRRLEGPPLEGAAELSYAVAPARQGRGVATAVVRELVTLAHAAGLRVVFAHTLAAVSACSRGVDSCRFPDSSTPTRARFGVGSFTSKITPDNHDRAPGCQDGSTQITLICSVAGPPDLGPPATH